MRNLLIMVLILGLIISLFFIIKKSEVSSPLVANNTENLDSASTNPASPTTTTETLETPTMVEATTSEMKEVETPLAPKVTKTLIAGGCFWCVEADIEKLKGVSEGVSGYAGGISENPTYKNYHDGGHREVVEVTYDENVVSLREIAIYALKHMDPTDGEGSFGDRGEYYAPALYYKDNAEKEVLESLIKTIEEKGPYQKPLAVDILPLPTFYKAEDYHQNYYKGTLSQVKYSYYRKASGRDDFIKTHWSEDTGPTLPWEKEELKAVSNKTMNNNWNNYKKPDEETLKTLLDPLTFKVTQDEGTERAGTHPYDKNYERGIYVDVLSGEPLYSSKDKFDSGTGWPSFVKPISKEAVTEHIDKKLFSTRTEIRSAVADNHLGHVFTDGPTDRGGMRYCMNGVALRFVPEDKMIEEGYGDWIASL